MDTIMVIIMAMDMAMDIRTISKYYFNNIK